MMDIIFQDIAIIRSIPQKEEIQKRLYPPSGKVGSLTDPGGCIVIDEMPFQKGNQIEVTETVLKDPILEMDGLYPSFLWFMDHEFIISGKGEFPLLHPLFQGMEVSFQIQAIGKDFILVPLVPSCLQIGKIEIPIGK